MLTERSKPMIPRWAVTTVGFGVAAAMGYAVHRSDYASLAVLSLVLLFILGADTAAMLHAWRGGPVAPPQPPPAGPVDLEKQP